MPPKGKPKKEDAPVAEEEPETRDPFFETTFLHGAVVLTTHKDEGSVDISTLINTIISQQSDYAAAQAEVVAAAKAAEADREALIAAGGIPNEPAPPQPVQDGEQPVEQEPPSIFSHVTFCVAEYTEVRRNAVSAAGTWKDYFETGDKIRKAHEECEDAAKQADAADWTLPFDLKALTMRWFVECQRARILREEEDRRLAELGAAQAKLDTAEAEQEATVQAIAAAKEAAVAAAIPPDMKKADITQEMKQAQRDANKALADLEAKLPRLESQIEERTAKRDAAEEAKGLPFNIDMVVFLRNYGDTAEELAQLNDHDACVQAVAWVKECFAPEPEPEPTGEEGDGPHASANAPPAEGTAAPEGGEVEAEREPPELVASLLELTGAANHWLAGVRRVALVEVEFTIPPKEEPTPEHPKPDPPPSAMELATQSLLAATEALVSQRAWYHNWRSELHAIEVPEFAEEKVDLAVYRTMLEGVATDRATVPVILHCLLEQVAFSMLDPEELARSAQLEAERDAAQHIDSLFDALVGVGDDAGHGGGGTSPEHAGTLDPADAGSVHSSREHGLRAASTLQELPLMHEADGVNHAAVFHQEGAEGSGEGQGALRVAEVETAMLQLLWLPGVRRHLLPDTPAMDEEERGRRKTAMAAHCMQGVSFLQMQRYDILKEMVSLLPTNARLAHEEGVLKRHHLENLPLASFAQIFTRAHENFPEMYTKYYPLEDSILLVLCSSEIEQDIKLSIPRALSFHDFWRECVSEGRGCAHLPAEVYVLEEARASVATSLCLVSTSDGALSRGEGPGTMSVVAQDMFVGLRTRTPALPMVVPPPPPQELGTEAVPSAEPELDEQGNPIGGEAVGAAKEAEVPAEGKGEAAAPPPTPPPTPPPVSMVYATYNGAFVTVTVDPAEPLPEGLEVSEEGGAPAHLTRSRIQVMTKSGMVTELTSAGAVLQGNALRSRDRPFTKPTGGSMADIVGDEVGTKEVFRCTTVEGVVCRNLQNGNVQMLMPDGNVAIRDVARSVWVATNNEGERWEQGDPYLPPPPPPPEPTPAEEEGEEQGAGKPASRPGSSRKDKKPASRPTSSEKKKKGGGDDKKGGDKKDKKGGKDGKKTPPVEEEVVVEPEVAPPPPPPPEPVTPPPIALSPLGVSHVEDPDTKTKVSARQDLVMTVDYPNHDFSVLFGDGTRFSRLPGQHIDWQVECEGFAPIQRKAGVISVDVGQGILTYDLAEGTMRLEGPDCGTLLVRGSKVVHAPACLSAPTASALAAMEETRRCWDLHQAMVQKHADWEQAQRDYITAMAAHEVLEEEAKAARLEFQANPPPPPAEGEAPAPGPPSAPPQPLEPVQPNDLVDPMTLFPPKTEVLQGCYLLDIEMHLATTCDMQGDGYYMAADGEVHEFGPSRQMLEEAMRAYEERVAEKLRLQEEKRLAALAAEEAARLEAEEEAARLEAEEAARVAAEARQNEEMNSAGSRRRQSSVADTRRPSRVSSVVEPTDTKAGEDKLPSQAEVDETTHGVGDMPGGDAELGVDHLLAAAQEELGEDGEGEAQDEEEPQEVWEYPYCAHYKPRMFIVYPDGKAVEILDKAAYELYAEQRRSDEACTITQAQVHGAEGEEGVTAHTFLSELTHRAVGLVRPLHVAPALPARPASAHRAMPSLRAPSKVAPLPELPPLAMPRIVAVPPQPEVPKPQQALVYRQVLEYPAADAEAQELLDASLHSYARWQEETDATTAETYRVPDARSEAEMQQESSVAEAILKARGAFDSQVASLRETRKEEEAERFEAAAGAAAEAASSHAHLKDRPAPVPVSLQKKLPNPMGELGPRPPVNFFNVEEGVQARKIISGEKPRTLPPQCLTLPRKTPPTLPPVTPDQAPSDSMFVPGMTLKTYTNGQTGFSANADMPRPPEMLEGDMGDAMYDSGDYDSNMGGMHTYYGSMSPETAEKIQARRDARALDVTGKPRKQPVDTIPALYRRSEAEPHPNFRYHEIEEDARRPLHTSSTVAMKGRGPRQQFQLTPAHIHFGHVAVGDTVVKYSVLSNVSPDTGHFFVRPVQPPLRIKYKPGMLAAGMGVKMEVIFTPEEAGDFCEDIYINTEFHHFVLTVSAKVVDHIGQTVSQMAEMPMSLAEEDENDENQEISNVEEGEEEPTKGELVPPDMTDIHLDENATLDEVKARLDSAGSLRQ